MEGSLQAGDQICIACATAALLGIAIAAWRLALNWSTRAWPVPERLVFSEVNPRLAFDGVPPWVPPAVNLTRNAHFGDGHSSSLHLLAARPRLFRAAQLVTSGEVEALLSAVEESGGFRRSGVREADGRERRDRATRSSSSSFIDGDAQRRRPGVLSVLHRAADLVGVPRAWVRDGSTLQVLRYHASEFYNAHYDSLPLRFYDSCREAWNLAKESPGWQGWARVRKQCPRFITILLYLSNVSAGGETCFPLADNPFLARLNESASSAFVSRDSFLADATQRCASRKAGLLFAAPRSGDAMVWYNYAPWEGADSAAGGSHFGDRESCALHMGMHVGPGEVKYAANLWIVLPWWRGNRRSGHGWSSEDL